MLKSLNFSNLPVRSFSNKTNQNGQKVANNVHSLKSPTPFAGGEGASQIAEVNKAVLAKKEDKKITKLAINLLNPDMHAKLAKGIATDEFKTLVTELSKPSIAEKVSGKLTEMSKSLDTRDMDKKEKEGVQKTLREASNDMNVIAQYLKTNGHKPASIAFKGMTRDKAERFLDKVADYGGAAYSIFKAGRAFYEKNPDKFAKLAADAVGADPRYLDTDQVHLIEKAFKFASDKNLVHFDHNATNLFMDTNTFDSFVLSDTMINNLPSSSDGVVSDSFVDGLDHIGGTDFSLGDAFVIGAGAFKAANGIGKIIETNGDEGAGKFVEGTADIGVGLATNFIAAKAAFTGAVTGAAISRSFCSNRRSHRGTCWRLWC